MLVITSAFLSAQATTAQNPLFIAKDLVANDTSNARISRIDSSPDLVQIKSAQMDFDRPQEASTNSLVDRHRPIALNPQTNVFASDVATMLQRKNYSNRISSTPAPSAWEASVQIPVPLPLTQTIRGVKTNRSIVNAPKVVKIYAKPNPLPIDNSAAPESSTEFIYPLMNPARISSRFGWRTHPLTGKRRFHSGLDIAAPSGAPVVATGSGTVISAGWNGGYGKAIVIQHNDTQQTLYGHLSEISVQPGQSIAQGTVIGLVGSTGNSTGPHLHFESRMPTDGVWTAVDPMPEIQYAVENLRRSMPYARKNLPPGY